MDFESIKSKVTKKHIIIGTSAIVLIAGGITAGVIANSSDEQAVNAPIAETQPTTEQVTTAVTTATTTTTKATTTTVATTTTIKTTKKTEKKKEDNKSDSSKTEVKEESNTAYEDDYSYDEPQYEEPVQQEAPVQQETPKQEEPKHEEPAPEPEPEPVYDRSSPEFWGYTGHDAELFNYALSQGCSGDAAQGYVMRCNYCGESNVFIGNPAPEDPNSYWGIWWTPDGGETWSTW